jgi:hypothetical protein
MKDYDKIGIRKEITNTIANSISLMLIGGLICVIL